jgi:transposase-like protein
VKGFCQGHGVREHSFYNWRKRFRERQQPMRFALVERGPARSEAANEAALELLLTNGERLRIGAGIDATTLRTVLAALRG